MCNALSAKGEYWVTSQFVWHYGSGKYRNAFSTNVGPGQLDHQRDRQCQPGGDRATLRTRSTIYAGYYDIGMWRTQDSGTSWTMINPVFAAWGGVGAATCVVADSARPGVVWAAIGESSKAPYLYRLYRSSHQRQLVAPARDRPAVPGVPVRADHGPALPTANRRLWVTANGALYRSTRRRG